jgi:hypothetical protein
VTGLGDTKQADLMGAYRLQPDMTTNDRPVYKHEGRGHYLFQSLKEIDDYWSSTIARTKREWVIGKRDSAECGLSWGWVRTAAADESLTPDDVAVGWKYLNDGNRWKIAPYMQVSQQPCAIKRLPAQPSPNSRHLETGSMFREVAQASSMLVLGPNEKYEDYDYKKMGVYTLQADMWLNNRPVYRKDVEGNEPWYLFQDASKGWSIGRVTSSTTLDYISAGAAVRSLTPNQARWPDGITVRSLRNELPSMQVIGLGDTKRADLMGVYRLQPDMTANHRPVYKHEGEGGEEGHYLFCSAGNVLFCTAGRETRWVVSDRQDALNGEGRGWVQSAAADGGLTPDRVAAGWQFRAGWVFRTAPKMQVEKADQPIAWKDVSGLECVAVREINEQIVWFRPCLLFRMCFFPLLPLCSLPWWPSPC